MSSTLFARGVNSQVGMKRKTDEITTNITNLTKEMLLMKQASEDVSVLRNDLSIVKKSTEEVAALKATVLSLSETVSALQKQVEALTSANK